MPVYRPSPAINVCGRQTYVGRVLYAADAGAQQCWRMITAGVALNAPSVFNKRRSNVIICDDAAPC